MARDSASISPTAHYTGYTWYRHGLSHPALATTEGRWMHAFLMPLTALAQAAGAPTLQGMLLARHHVMDHLLAAAVEEGRVAQIIEVAAGLSPRGWQFKRRFGSRLRYIEADLPDMACRKRAMLKQAGLETPGHEVVELDALADEGPASLQALAAELDAKQGLAIVTEGLINYFSTDEVCGMWRRFAAALAGFPHGLYVSDLHMANVNRGVLTEGFMAVLSTFVRGRVYRHFNSSEEACAKLREAGFHQAAVHLPADVLLKLQLPVLPGADLVRVIEARC